jgi:hypothetical protein
MTTRLTDSERGANKPKGQGLCFQMTSEITIINMVTIILKKVMIMLNNALHVCLKCSSLFNCFKFVYSKKDSKLLSFSSSTIISWKITQVILIL